MLQSTPKKSTNVNHFKHIIWCLKFLKHQHPNIRDFGMTMITIYMVVETSYTSTFVKSFNSRIIGSILTLQNIDASNWSRDLFFFSPITWYVLIGERYHSLLEALSIGFYKMAYSISPIEFNTTFFNKMELIISLNLVERVCHEEQPSHLSKIWPHFQGKFQPPLNLPLCLVERLKYKERTTHTLKSIMHKLFCTHKTNVQNVQHFHSQTIEG
jgi:hypothetical protein